ncbi:hypothetical protein [Halomonas cupida]|uniref:hypothetical protein n=1 Tax=Halomonas cupida TaxID=44933 RepID=UPI003A8F7575
MKALERSRFDLPIGQAGSDSTVIDSVRRKRGMMSANEPKSKIWEKKPSVASEARKRGIRECWIRHFLSYHPEYRGKDPAVVCDAYERYQAERPETMKDAAARHGINTSSLSSFKRRHGLADLTPEELCQRYMEYNERMEA